MIRRTSPQPLHNSSTGNSLIRLALAALTVAFLAMSSNISVAQTFVRNLQLTNASSFDPAPNIFAEEGSVAGGSTGETNPETGLIVHNATIGASAVTSFLSWARVGLDVQDGIISSGFRVDQSGRYEIVVTGLLSGGVIEGQTSPIHADIPLPGAGFTTGVMEISTSLLGELDTGPSVLRLRDLAEDWSNVFTAAGLSALQVAIETAGPIGTGVNHLIDVLSTAAFSSRWESEPFVLRSNNYLSAGQDYNWNFLVRSVLASGQLGNTVSAAHYNLTVSGLTVELWHMGDPVSHTVSASSGSNGSISPSGDVSVMHGGAVNFYATPDFGYRADRWYVDGVDVGRFLQGVTAFEDRSVLVTFKEIPPPQLPLTEFGISGYTVDDSRGLSAKNNGDGIFQSGEEIRFRPLLSNIGSTDARDVRLLLSSSEADVLYLEESIDYPDLPPGYSAYPAASQDYRADAEFAFEGFHPVSLRVEWMDGTAWLDMPNAFELEVHPAAWAFLVDDQFNFGLASPGDSVVFPMSILNYGSAEMQVTGFEITDELDREVTDTSANLEIFPIGAGQTVNVSFEIDTTELDGPIVRHVRFLTHDGRLRRPDHGMMTITGYVASAGTSVSEVPGTTNAGIADIGGNWIAWSASGDIHAYNLMTSENRRITTDVSEQRNPRVSGNLIAWEDSRNQGSGDTNFDVFGYDLLLDEEFVVSADPVDEFLAGIDGQHVAIGRLYHTIDYPGWGHNLLYNMWLIDVGLGLSTNLTGFTPAGNNPMRSVVRRQAAPDFGDGLLVWHENERYPRNDGSGAWRLRNSQLFKFRVGSDLQPAVAVTSGAFSPGWSSYLPVSNGSFAWVDWDADDDDRADSIRVWSDGTSYREIYEPGVSLGESMFAMGGGHIVYDMEGTSGIFSWNMSSGERALLSTQGNATNARMDQNGVVWRTVNDLDEGILNFAFIEQPDIAIGWVDWDFSEVGSVNMSIQVFNLTDFNLADDILVRLYDGDPDAEGDPLGVESVLAGGLGPNESHVIVFPNVILPDGWSGRANARIYARLILPGYDNPENNSIQLVPEPALWIVQSFALIAVLLLCVRGRRRTNFPISSVITSIRPYVITRNAAI